MEYTHANYIGRNQVLDNSNQKSTKITFLFSVSIFVAQNFWGASMLANLSPKLGYLLFLISNSAILGWWGWLLVGSIYKKQRFVKLIKSIGTLTFVILFILTSPLYVDIFVIPKGTIEFERPYYDSTQVTVRYGTRETDFFWTQKTIGELKQKSSVALNVNGHDIFNIYTDGRQIIVDAILFAGYENQIVADYTTIGSMDKFSITMDGNFNTDNGSNKYYYRKRGVFELKMDSIESGKITASILGQPTMIKNKALAQPVTITNSALSREVEGWKIWKSSVGFEVTNENNIPVLVVEYKSPYSLTISGLFATPMGILKVDNSKDTIFSFGDSPFELGTYRVDRIRMYSVFDLFRPERTYILSDKGRE